MIIFNSIIEEADEEIRYHTEETDAFKATLRIEVSPFNWIQKNSLWAISLICIDQLVSTVFKHIVTSYDIAHLKCYLYKHFLDFLNFLE